MIGWVDASAGASGDMLLGAMVGAGVPVGVLSRAVGAVVEVDPPRLVIESVDRGGLAAVRCRVERVETSTRRTLQDVVALLDAAALPPGVRDRAVATFGRLARAEAHVHGCDVSEVHFHEVGALDAIADLVGVGAGLEHLGLDALVVSTIGVGSGSVAGAHGTLSVPVPAVVELLRGVPTSAGPAVGPSAGEACTPTGAALLAEAATAYGAQPAMSVLEVGVGAGGRDPEGHANVCRLLVGEPLSGPVREEQVLVETNVDDLDPRLWPETLSAVLGAGAVDAWLTPILMKKGRPAHTLSALVPRDRLEEVRRVVFTVTTAIGLRESELTKTACERHWETVEVEGHAIRIKLATWRGRVVNAQPEYDDVVAAAHAAGRPVGETMDLARAAYRSG